MKLPWAAARNSAYGNVLNALEMKQKCPGGFFRRECSSSAGGYVHGKFGK